MYFIVTNPKAERGRTMFYLPMLTNLFDAEGIPYETHITTGEGDAREKTLKFCQKNPSLQGVISIGGDGTIQETVSAMAEAYPDLPKIPVPLGIFPSTTGTDFILSLEGGKKKAKAKYQNTEAVCKGLFEDIKNKNCRAVDVLTANNMAFLNIGHVGIDVRITKNATELKQKYDQYAFFAAIFKSIREHKNMPLTVETDAKTYKNEYTMVTVANGQYYGGGMHICPTAKLDDGKMTLCQITKMSRPRAMTVFPTVFWGKVHLLKESEFAECTSIKITLPPGEETLCLDGNLFPCSGEIEFKILPKALDIFHSGGHV